MATNNRKRTGQNNKVFSLKTTPGAGRRTNPKASTKPKPKPKPKPTVADYTDAQGNTYDGNTGRLKVAAPKLRSPAIGAPVHASPSAFGSSQKLQQQAVSPYVGSSAATPARPSTPAQAAQQPTQPQPMSPQYGGNDEPGRLGQSEGGYAGRISQPSPVGPVTDGGDYDHMVQATRPQQPAGGPDANGIDMERRRAFLDADNSLDGLKAVKELLNRRKLSISVEN